jgi:coenzyme F420-reducing hydrogenase delta subunit
MPQLPVDGLRRQVRAGLDALRGERKVLLFGCDQAADIAALRNPDAAGISLLCAGQLPPSFIEFALRAGATEVVVATCAEGACAYRLGNRWTVERLAGEREPHLRASVPAGRYRVVHASRGDEAQLTVVIDEAVSRSE